MRNDLVHIGAGELSYEIRAIVAVAEEMARLGLPVIYENIGDPVAKGERIPEWMKAIVRELVDEDATWGYSPTKGVLATRQFLAERVNARGGVRIGPEDLLFFNGLGDAIQKVYGFLRREARVIGPSPSYSTHSSGEAAHAGLHPVTYRLDPDRGWAPDLEDLRLSVRYNPSVSGLLVINPHNPTGAVWGRETMAALVAVAREHDLFVLSDEIYGNLTYNGAEACPLSDVIGEVPGLAMKGISKELPWPGSRCGWVEVYNRHRDPVFDRYVKSIEDAKMVEVCATTLPQRAIPPIFSHPEYPGWLDARRRRYERASRIAHELLAPIPGVKVSRTDGAFYQVVAFEPGALTPRQTLPIASPAIRARVEALVAEPRQPVDKRLVYYLLGATGLCTVPLSSFHTPERGLRLTLLETDEATLVHTYRTLAEALRAYLVS